MINQLSSGKA